MPKRITNPIPTPTYNAGGGRVITRYDEIPIKTKRLSLFPYATMSKYGSVIPQKQISAGYVKTTYPRVN
jgi:hypothetical protein